MKYSDLFLGLICLLLFGIYEILMMYFYLVKSNIIVSALLIFPTTKSLLFSIELFKSFLNKI